MAAHRYQVDAETVSQYNELVESGEPGTVTIPWRYAMSYGFETGDVEPETLTTYVGMAVLAGAAGFISLRLAARQKNRRRA